MSILKMLILQQHHFKQDLRNADLNYLLFFVPLL